MGIFDAPAAPWPTKDLFGRLIDRDIAASVVWRNRSNGVANGAWSSKSASEFTETWNTAPVVAGDSRWSPYTSGKLNVSGGYLVGTATSDGTSGLNHALSLLPNQSATIYTTVVTSGAGGNCIVGISSDTAGGTVTSGMTTTKGLSFHTAASGVQKFDNGSESASSNSTAWTNNVTYSVTIRLTPTWYSIVAVSADGTQEYRAQWARSSVTANNLALYNGVTDGSRKIGPVTIVYGPALASPTPLPTAVGGSALGGHHHTIWQELSTGGMLRVAVPPSWDSRGPNKWVLMFHGNGSDETHWADNANGKVVANALLGAGFVVIGFTSASTTTWGAQAELIAAETAIRLVRDGMNLGQGGFYCNSMGSINGLLAIAQRIVPDVRFYVGTSPTFSLLANYDNAGQSFTASINTAYGITSSTLAASASIGAGTVSSNASFAAGTQVLINYANAIAGSYEQATVQSVSGSGPYTLTLTAPLAKNHASGVTISNYPDKTAGHDPSLLSAESFMGVPYLVLAASDDTTVAPATNAALIPAKLNTYAPEQLSKQDNTGGHSFDFTPYTLRTSVYDIVNFIRRHTA